MIFVLYVSYSLRQYTTQYKLCGLANNPLSIAASTDSYVYDGEAMIDSGAADHIIGSYHVEQISVAEGP